MFNTTKPDFSCPICGARLNTVEPDKDRRLDCEKCGSTLVLEFRYFWLYRFLCFIAAISVAYFQNLEGFVFLFALVIYNFIFFFIGARTILPLFPMEIRTATSNLTAIDISKHKSKEP